MLRVAILKRPFRAVAVAVLASLISPAAATSGEGTVQVFPELPAAAVQNHRSTLLTSQTPWIAPVGHRQPRQADVPQREVVSGWERQQLQAAQELDRKLVICRRC